MAPCSITSQGANQMCLLHAFSKLCNDPLAKQTDMAMSYELNVTAHLCICP